jgi:hypothetical protein
MNARIIRILAIWCSAASTNWKIARRIERRVPGGISGMFLRPGSGGIKIRARAGDVVDRKSAGCAVSPVSRRSITSRYFLMVSARLTWRPGIFDSIERKPTVSVTLRNFGGRDPPVAWIMQTLCLRSSVLLEQARARFSKTFSFSPFDVPVQRGVALSRNHDRAARCE